MKEETSVITNGSVSIYASRVYSFSRFNHNTYKVAGEEVSATSLSPIQRGHIYVGENLDDGRILVTSLRICDQETVPLVVGLTSLKNADESLVGSRFAAQANHAKALNYSFSVAKPDWVTFHQRVVNLGGQAKLEAASMPEISKLSGRLDELLDDACTLSRICKESLEGLQTYKEDGLFEEVGTLLEQLDELQTYQTSAGKILRDLRRQQELAKAAKASSLVAFAGGILGGASKKMQALKKKADPTTMQKAVQKFLESSGAETDIIRKAFPLDSELAWLTKHYPVLAPLKAKGVDGLIFKVTLPEIGSLSIVVTNTSEYRLEASDQVIGRLLKGQQLDKGADGDSRFATLDLE